jgi:hypothetical protein
MLVVVSPAKRLDWTPEPGIGLTEPAFAAEACRLAASARRLTRAELRALMGISEDLATLNRRRFRDFAEAPAPEAVRPAIHAFAGDTYRGLDARSLGADALAWAEGHLRILSGLYGLLRPFDAIQPYRLEMGSRLRTRRGPDLYAFWGDRIARALNAAAAEAGTGLLLNAASQEYFAAVDQAALRLRVISPVFLDGTGPDLKIVGVHAKRARGALARFVLERRIVDPAALRDFDAGGYRHRPDMSEGDRLVFTRAPALSDAA